MASGLTPLQTNPAVSANQWIRGLVFISLFGALFIVASTIKISIGLAVPISLGTFAIMLAGGLLGAVYGFWSIAIVVILTALGLPLIGNGGGMAKILGPTGGYIWMYPFAAFLIGWASDRLLPDRSKPSLRNKILLVLSLFIFGALLVYVTGVYWLAHEASGAFNLPAALKAGMYPFIPGDAIKALAAAYIILVLKPVISRIRPLKKAKAD